MYSPVDLLAASVADAAPNYAKVTTGDLDRATPCDAWDLAEIEIDYVGRQP